MRVKLPDVQLYIISVFLICICLSGIIKYYSYKSGLIIFSYLPAICALMLISIRTYINYGSGKLKSGNLLLFIVFVCYTLYGLINSNDIGPSLFGAYLFIYFIMGYNTELSYILNPKIRKLAMVLVFVSLFGAVLDYFGDVFWAGAVYEIGDLALESTKSWVTGENGVYFERVAGFSRSSIDLAVGSLLLLSLSIGNKKLQNLLLYTCVVITVLISTTKVAIVAICIAGLAYLFNSKKVLLSIIFISSSLMVFLPVISILSGITIPSDTLVQRLAFSSIAERFNTIWPSAIGELSGISYILGSGIGSIGSPLYYFSPDAFNAGDNLFVYIFKIFGVLGIFFFIKLILNISRISSNLPHSLYISITCLMIIGITMNIVESAAMSFLLGIVFAGGLNDKKLGNE